MRPIVIQGAMSVEIEEYVSHMKGVTMKTIGNHKFYHGLYQGYPVIVALTEIGMVNCGISTTLVASEEFPVLILNQGVAGSHSMDLHVGDIVIGEKSVSINSFEKPLCKEGVCYENWKAQDFFAQKDARFADLSLVDIFQKAEYTQGKKVLGVLGSGDVWNREWEYIDWLERTLGSSCEDMESLACYQVAEEFAVPVVGVRMISNNERTEEDYVPEVATRLQKFILEQLPSLIAWAVEKESI